MRDVVTKALAIIQKTQQQEVVRYEQRQPMRQNYQPVQTAILDLPRVCAIHLKPWVARYINGDYAQGVPIRERHMGQYGGELQRVDRFGFEECPWCGGYSDDWTGAIHCTSCHRKMCFGTTVKNYFRCPCGGGGELRSSSHADAGVMPEYGRSGNGGI